MVTKLFQDFFGILLDASLLITHPMRSFLTIFLTCIAFISSHAAMAQGLYVSDRINASTLGSKGTLKLGLYIKPLNFDENAEVSSPGLCPAADIAFSPLKHIALLASWRSVINKNAFFNGAKFNGHHFDLGLGYYYKHGVFRCDVFAGYGKGSIKESDIRMYYNIGSTRYETLNDYRVSYDRFFLQGSIALYIDAFCVSFGTRILREQYHHPQYADTNVPKHIVGGYTPDLDLDGKSYLYAEPYFDFQYGSRTVKANLQFGLTQLLSGMSVIPDGIDGPAFLSIGVNMYIRSLLGKNDSPDKN